jgi:hypothetical protein
VFTPTANSVTTVPLNFPMTEEGAPPENDTTTIIANDLVALEVLSGDVPLPGFWTKNGGADTTIANYLWLPALSASNTQAPSTELLNYTGSFSGFVPLFAIDYRPGG